MSYQIEPSVSAFCHGKWNGNKFIKSEPSDVIKCCNTVCDNYYDVCMKENKDINFCKKRDQSCRDGCFLYNYAEDHYIQDCIEEACPTFDKTCINSKKDTILACCKESCPTGDCCKGVFQENYTKNSKENQTNNFYLFFIFSIIIIVGFFISVKLE